jgi:uncharacterized membrane protein
MNVINDNGDGRMIIMDMMCEMVVIFFSVFIIILLIGLMKKDNDIVDESDTDYNIDENNDEEDYNRGESP